MAVENSPVLPWVALGVAIVIAIYTFVAFALRIGAAG